MTLTRKTLRKYVESAGLILSERQIMAIMFVFGTEPGDGHEWSEQDVYEQVRIILRDWDVK